MRLNGAILVLVAAACMPALALETDQYYTWDKPLDDATEVLNAKVNLEIGLLVQRINRRTPYGGTDCGRIREKVVTRFTRFLFHNVGLWAANSPFVDRIPLTPDEELRYRREYLYHDGTVFDLSSWVPPAPTIQLNGVRLGTDKLAHFFSEGWNYYRWYRSALQSGLPREQAVNKAIDRGLRFERTILGMTSSGVLSLSDLEADHAGMRFYRDLCDGDSPLLEEAPDGWRMTREFDFGDYVTPEWDESYHTPIYNKRRWRKVRPVLMGYCHLLDDPQVVERRRRYTERDSLTPTEARVRRRIAAGKLPDPDRFSIETNCRAEAAIQSSGSAKAR